MKRKRLRLLAVTAALSMAVTSVLPAMAAPDTGDNARNADPLENQVLDLEFEGNLNDSTGTIEGISMVGNGYDYVAGVNGGQALSLTGNTHVVLGNDVRLQPKNLTLSFWIKPNEEMSGEQIITWNKDEYYTDGWYLSSLNDNTPLALSVGSANTNGQPYNVTVSGNRSEFFKAGEWTHIVVTYDSITKDVQIYRNGTAQETKVAYGYGEASNSGATGVLGQNEDMEKSIGYNGPKHNQASSCLKAALDHYELWNDVASADQVQALYEEGKTVAPEQTLTNQVLDLEFEDNLTDNSTVQNQITMSSGSPSYVEGVGDQNGKALNLTGNAYVNLGKKTELQPSKLTLSFWIKPNKDWGTDEQIITWSKNEYYTDGWYLSSENDSTPLALSVGPATVNGQPYKISVKATRSEFFPTDRWTHIVVTYDSDTKEAAIYRNGIAQSLVKANLGGASTGVIGSDASMEKSIGYNGPSYKGSYLNAALDHYELWNDVATYEEAIALYEEQGGSVDKKAIAQSDLDALVIPEQTSRNLSLPATGESGSVITWEVTAGDAMTDTGVIKRPEAGHPDAQVTLEATAVFLDGEEVTKTFTVTVLAEKLMDLSDTSIMDQVTLEDDYLVNAFTKEKEYLLSLSSEKFLYEFQNVAGLTPAADSGYGGWERTGASNFRGHTFGHYMSALSQAYLSEDDASTKEKLMDQIKIAVEGLKECQDAYAQKYPQSAGYISAFPEGVLARVDGGTSPTADDNTVLVPYYNLHKVLAGLIDIAKNVDDQEVKNTAIDVAESFGEYLYNRCTNLSDVTVMLRTEYGGMNEALYELYRITGNDHIKEAAECFDEVALFQQLANNQDVLSGLHANTTIPKLTGALKRYTVLTEAEYYEKLTDDEKASLDMYLTAAKNFWDIVINDHTYITGGNSQWEHFRNPGELCYDATKSSYEGALTCETCNTYNMLKLTKALYDVTGDSKYLDYFERTFTNAILASQNPETGTTMYFQPMAAGYNKVYNRPEDEFWCCTGTGMENFSKLGDYIYLIKGNTLYVNMFYSSSITDTDLGITLKQEANIPNSDKVTFTVEEIGEGTSVALRQPEWLAGDAAITVNDVEQQVTAENGFFVLDDLNNGDVISYTMPMQVEVESTADNANFVAFKYGPVVLAAELGSNDITASQANGILVRAATEDTSAKDTITVQNMSVDDWKANVTENLVRIEDSEDGKVQFQLKNTDSEELIFSPYYELHDQRYGIYMNLEEPDSQASQDRILSEKEQLREQEVSVDYLNSFDANNSEAAKDLITSETDTSVGTFNGRTFRHAENGGWWSYNLAVDPEAEHNYLACTWYSGDRGRVFDIYVNDELLQTVTITDDAGTNVFYEDIYDLTEYIKDGASEVTVKFQSYPNDGDKINYAGGLFGLRVITSTEYDTDARLSDLTFDKGTLSPAFDPDTTEYTLTVGTDVDSVNMLASTMKESGLVYIGDILFDNDNVRTIRLDGDTTVVELTSKAQDHTTAKKYTITIVKSDDVDQPEDYEVLEGGNGQWTNDSKNGYSFKISGSADKFVGVKVDGTTLDASDYTLDKDNMVVTLSAEFLSALETKEHTVTFVYADGQVSTKLTIKAAGGGQEPGGEGGQEPGDGDGQQTGDNDQKNDGKDQNSDGGKGSNAPQTGDTTNIFGPAAACVLALGMAGTILYIRRKRS